MIDVQDTKDSAWARDSLLHEARDSGTCLHQTWVKFFFSLWSTRVLHARWCKSRRITQPPRRLDLTVSANNMLGMVLLIPGHTPVPL